MKVSKAVITAAGLGTRLLSVTKEMPKEMLPLFSPSRTQEIGVKPVLQLIFEQLYEKGVRLFCFIVGRGKRSVEDFFTPDYHYVELLRKRGKVEAAEELEDFYRKIESSVVVWINQPEPQGFGDAVLRSEPFVGDEPFLVYAGDTYIISEGHGFLERMLNAFTDGKAHAVLLLKEIPKASQLKHYGVAEVEESGEPYLEVVRVVEKPEKPPSNLAIMPVYIFSHEIFASLKTIPKGRGNELQLTDAIQHMITRGLSVRGVKMVDGEVRLDVGVPETYWEALKYSYSHALSEAGRSSGEK